MHTRRMLSFYMVAAAWGLVAAIINFSVTHHAPLWLRLTFDGVLAVIMFLAGRRAKQQGLKPWHSGAIAGVLYSLFSSWPVFFIRYTRAELVRTLKGKAVSSAQVTTSLHLLNSFTPHVVEFLGAAVLIGAIGIVVGIVGGATAKSSTDPMDV